MVDDEDRQDGEDPVDDCHDGAYRDGVAEANNVEERGRVIHECVESVRSCQLTSLEGLIMETYPQNCWKNIKPHAAVKARKLAGMVKRYLIALRDETSSLRALDALTPASIYRTLSAICASVP